MRNLPTISESIDRDKVKQSVLLLLALLIILLPVVNEEVLFRYQFEDIKLLTLDITTSVIAFFYVVRTRSIKFSPMVLFIIFLLLCMLISITYSSHKTASFIYLFRFINTVFLIAFVSMALREKVITLEQLITVVYISSVVFVACYIYGKYYTNTFNSMIFFSPLGHFNYTGHVLNVWIPLVIMSVYLQKNILLKLIGILIVILLVNILIASSSRGSIFGLVFSELLLVVIFAVKEKTIRHFPFITASLILFFIINLLYFPNHIQQTLNKFEHLKRFVITGSHPQSINQQSMFTHIQRQPVPSVINEISSGRRNMYLNTVDMIMDNPFGVGLNNFKYIHPKYAKFGTTSASPMVGLSTVLTHPHNLLLKYASEIGVIGVTLFLIILLMFVKMVFYNLLNGDMIDYFIAISFGASLFHSMLSAVFLTPGSILFVSIVMALILYRDMQLNDKVLEYKSYYARLGYLYWIVIVFFGAIYLSKYYDAQYTKQKNFDYIKKAIVINPFNEAALIKRARFEAYVNHEYETALSLMQRYVDLYPYSLIGLIDKAKLEMKLKRYNNLDSTVNTYLMIDKMHPCMNSFRQFLDRKK